MRGVLNRLEERKFDPERAWKKSHYRVVVWGADGQQDHGLHKSFRLNQLRQAKKYANDQVKDGAVMVAVELVSKNQNYPGSRGIQRDDVLRLGPLA